MRIYHCFMHNRTCNHIISFKAHAISHHNNSQHNVTIISSRKKRGRLKKSSAWTIDASQNVTALDDEGNDFYYAGDIKRISFKIIF